MTIGTTITRFDPRWGTEELRTLHCRFMVTRAAALFALLISPLGSAHAQEDPLIAIRAGTVHVGNGDSIEGGVVLIRGDRISLVGADVTVPAGATVIDLKNGSVTPGLIDANATIAVDEASIKRPGDARMILHDLFASSHRHHRTLNGISCCGSTCPLFMQHVDGKACPVCGFPNAAPRWAVGAGYTPSMLETSSEVIPHTRVIDSVNLHSEDFDRLLRGGVTTVYISPDTGAVISSRGAVVHTGGPIGDRVVREADAVLATMGMEPSWRGMANSPPWRESVTFYARRPTTRMGVTWVFRKALFDAQKAGRGLAVDGADTPSPQALAALQDVLAGKIPLRIQARMQHDILSALRLAAEFQLSFALVEGTESYKCLSELKEFGTPVIYGPIFISAPGERGWGGETDEARLFTLKSLLEDGVPTALTACELREEDGLARQAMYARRYGISLADVIRSVTQTPAQLMGLESELGTLESGKRADLIVWSAAPFESTSRPLIILVGGKIILDDRNG